MPIAECYEPIRSRSGLLRRMKITDGPHELGNGRMRSRVAPSSIHRTGQVELDIESRAGATTVIAKPGLRFTVGVIVTLWALLLPLPLVFAPSVLVRDGYLVFVGIVIASTVAIDVVYARFDIRSVMRQLREAIPPIPSDAAVDGGAHYTVSGG